MDLCLCWLLKVVFVDILLFCSVSAVLCPTGISLNWKVNDTLNSVLFHTESASQLHFSVDTTHTRPSDSGSGSLVGRAPELGHHTLSRIMLKMKAWSLYVHFFVENHTAKLLLTCWQFCFLRSCGGFLLLARRILYVPAVMWPFQNVDLSRAI